MTKHSAAYRARRKRQRDRRTSELREALVGALNRVLDLELALRARGEDIDTEDLLSSREQD